MASFRATAVAVCEQCYKTFYLTADDMVILPNTSTKLDRYRRTGKNATIKEKVLRTWSDWMEYLQTHCPQCRYTDPPAQCVEDYERLLKKMGRRE